MEILTQYNARPAGCDARVLTGLVRRVAGHVLKAEERPAETEVSILFVDDAEMRELNRTYRNIDRPTDVLAFSMQEGDRVLGQETLLGDVVISLDTAKRQADEQGHTWRKEIAVLLVHGVLHLLGYDHDEGNVARTEAEEMRQRERKYLRELESSLVV